MTTTPTIVEEERSIVLGITKQAEGGGMVTPHRLCRIYSLCPRTD